MNKLDLTALLERVRNAVGSSRDLDRAIHVATNPPLRSGLRFGNVPAYTASVDDALALAERVLPGWVVADLRQNSRHAGDPWGCTLAIYYGSSPSKNRLASSGYDFQTAPLALLTALLLALTSNQEGNDEA